MGELIVERIMKSVPTDSGVSNKRLFVLEHGIDGDFLTVLRCDDGNGRLFVRRNRGHLLDNFNLFILMMDSGERVELH